MLKIALVGAGSFGSKILSKLSNINNINCINILNSESKWEDIDNVDWVIISTPTEFHYEQVKYFLNKGINVFCEKPCTLSYNSTKELIELSKEKNVKLYIDDVLMFDSIDLSSNQFIYKKWSKPTNNIIDRIVYHHLYLLYNPDIEAKYTNLKILKNDSFDKHFKFDLNGQTYEFIYDLYYYKKKIHNVVLDNDNDALTDMLTLVFNNNVSFDINHNRALFATKLSEQLKKDLYGTVAIIGGGVYGITAAIKLKDSGYEVDLYEKEDDILKAASGINQYRVHRGYHYPRSSETIQSCRDNEKQFLKYYRQSILNDNIKHLYAISKENSLTTAKNYLKVLDENKLEWELDNNLPGCDLTVKVKEQLYNPNILNNICKDRLHGNGVNIKFNTPWDKKYNESYKYIVYATYANLNEVTNEEINYQFELCEKPLLKLPDIYKNVSVVIMDGPFMCFDPYCDTEYHLGGNVVHAIHLTNIGIKPDIPNVYKDYINKGIIKNPKYTNIDRFIESAKQFFPDIENAEHIGSMYTIRTVLPNTDKTDERPTIVRKLNKKEFVIFSGKIVNCVDAADKLIKMIYE